MNNFADQNLLQTQKSLQLIISTYDYMLYQMYTDRQVIDIIDHINKGENIEENSIALTQALRTFIYGQSYVQAVSVITDNGKIFFFDRLKGYHTENSWLKDSSIPISHIYKQTLSSDKNNIFSTKSGMDFSGKIYYYCHIAHSIVDYKDTKQKKGIVILSINADVLNKTSNANLAFRSFKKNTGFCFIVDQNNNVVSFPKEEFIGKNLLSTNSEDITKACKDFITKNKLMKSDNIDIQILKDEMIGWKLVRVSDNENIMNYINKQYQITALILVIVSILLGLLIFFINKHVFESLNNLIKNMKISETGKVLLKNKRPIIKEIDSIYQNFDNMLQHINMLITRIKYITKQQKDYEIKSLEMQINPHFLYNSLDMINWMSIDAGEYQISDAIHSLAQILRYSITDINMPVTIDKEVVWLERYLHLQQMRFKGVFDYRINISPEARSCLIYKMILQPFVENAILHGFSGQRDHNKIQVEIYLQENKLHISIKDNGRGMPPEVLAKVKDLLKNRQVPLQGRIGLHNVFNRLRLYYEQAVTVTLESQPEDGTLVWLSIPVIRGVER
ncbi:sensor histidine kinase [Propionispora sp. 2/2-37]|uniref:sensor histidine kinase n=1 Tax=Propionispora sp. 2/2-37 TaxID=1677858 RepID=UPI00155D9FAD|nr:sensor histidine kinase [Propionispora sp. 2/2-37]